VIYTYLDDLAGWLRRRLGARRDRAALAN
jgi:hypothetical protein